MRLFYCLLIGWLLSVSGNAQTEPKKTEHYAAVQVNKLLKEIINLNANNIINDNPYFLNYTIYSTRCGYGLNFGIGYDYSKSSDEENPDGRLLQSTDLNYRIGICKKVALTSRCELSYGIDFVGEFNQIKSYSNNVVTGTNFKDSSYFQTTNLAKSIGGGLSGVFRFYLSKSILVGSEASYYLHSSKVKMHSLVYTHNQFQTTTNNSIEVQNSSDKDFNVKFDFPVAIFIIFKF